MARGEQEGGGGVRNQATRHLALGVSALEWRESSSRAADCQPDPFAPSLCKTLEPRSRSRCDEKESGAS